VVVRIIARNTLVRLVASLTGHKDYRVVKSALDAWFQEIRQAEWKRPNDVKEYYGNASIIGPDRVVFNIKGNAYRLVAAIDYRRGIVFIKWLGSHQEYDKIDVRTVQYDDQAHQD
jgi:mRNA interferase HigB